MIASTWWSTPARPSSWFSDDELARSRSYHEPLARAAALRGVARLAALIVAQWFTLRLVDNDAKFFTKLLVAVPLGSLAWWVPSAMVDVWFEYRHEVHFGHRPLSFARFSLGSLTSLAIGTVMLGVSAATVYGLMSVTKWWVIPVVALNVVVIPLMMHVEPSLTAASHNVEPLGLAEAEPLLELADRAGVGAVEFARMESDAINGLNALTAGAAGKKRIVLTSELVTADSSLRSHVVAHELAHLRLGHVRTTAWATGHGSVFVVFGLGLVAWWAQPFEWIGLDRVSDPRGLALLLGIVAVLSLVVMLPLAWMGRSFERAADQMALQLTGPVPLPVLRLLHVTERADLDPSVFARLAGAHPPPAERLSLACRIGQYPPIMRTLGRDQLDG